MAAGVALQAWAALVTAHLRQPGCALIPDTVASAAASKSPPAALQEVAVVALAQVAASSKARVSLWAVNAAPVPVLLASHSDNVASVTWASAGISLA